MKKILILLLVTFSFAQIFGQESELYDWLTEQKNLVVNKIEHDEIFEEAYEIFITQPVDHNNPDGQTFKQQVFISYKDKCAPVILNLEGYAADNRVQELSRMLNANQITVEHRYFGESVPDPLDWQYLTIKQAADDHHKIVKLLKEYFDGDWISMGISKGGQTTYIHRYYYPDDVDVSVPYVAPLNFSRTDPRIHEFISEKVSTEECREKVLNFQKTVLKNKDELIPLWEEEVKDHEYSIGLKEAFEYSVLEYSFAFWQWGNNSCEEIPGEDASNEDLIEHLIRNSPPEYFSDADIKKYEPFFYQAYVEIGYYDYDITSFGDLIEYVDGGNQVFDPKDAELIYNYDLMKEINEWLKTKAEGMIFIYGEDDPWSATAVEIDENDEVAVKFLPEGNHRTRIKSFPEEEQEEIIEQIEEWLD